jgi:hypothetical protein
MRIIPALIVASSLVAVTAFAATRETPAEEALGDGGADGLAAATSVSVSASSVTTVTVTGATTTATTTTSSASGRGR